MTTQDKELREYLYKELSSFYLEMNKSGIDRPIIAMKQAKKLEKFIKSREEKLEREAHNNGIQYAAEQIMGGVKPENVWAECVDRRSQLTPPKTEGDK